jgi:hypothetical protein
MMILMQLVKVWGDWKSSSYYPYRPQHQCHHHSPMLLAIADAAALPLRDSAVQDDDGLQRLTASPPDTELAAAGAQQRL